MDCPETSEITDKAEEGIEKLAEELFNSKKLKYLNMKEVQGEKQEEKAVRRQFEGFVKKVSRAVFLSAEGVYEEEGPSILSFSEEEEEDVSEVGMNKFARAYS